MAARRRARVPHYLTVAEVAARLHVSERTLRRLVATGKFPPPVRHGGAGDPVWECRVVTAYAILAPLLPELFRLSGKTSESKQ